MDILRIEYIAPGEESWEEPTTYQVTVEINMGSSVDISLKFNNASPADPHGPESTFQSRIAMLPIDALQVALDFARESQKAMYETFLGKSVPQDTRWRVLHKHMHIGSKEDISNKTPRDLCNPHASKVELSSPEEQRARLIEYLNDVRLGNNQEEYGTREGTIEAWSECIMQLAFNG